MPSLVQPPSSKPQRHQRSSKEKFRTVLGLGGVFKDPDVIVPYRGPNTRKSVDIPRTYKAKRKHRVDRESVVDGSFFDAEKETTDIATDNEQKRSEPFVAIDDMKHFDANHSRQSRRPPVRMDAQDGPWSVSVAETPYDARSYSLYIKTPTHNLTLTRTAQEIVELHRRLRESHPGTELPVLPIDLATLPPPTKRKSTFLNTLSRLASPSGNRSARYTTARPSNASSTTSAVPPTLPTLVMTPTLEINDPFTASDGSHPTTNGTTTPISAGEPLASPVANNAITALAAYLTTLSNAPAVRQARVWKRFVRVRTDDLESVRVERAIKRVRSDLAAHISPKTPTEPSVSAISAEAAIKGSLDEVEMIENGEGAAKNSLQDGIEEEQEEVSIMENGDTLPNGDVGHDAASEESTVDGVEDIRADSEVTSIVNGVDDHDLPSPLTPVVTDSSMSTSSRIPRSHSADPDKSSRLSRAYTSSTQDTGMSQAGDQTGDESSASTTGNRRARKKRYHSVDPNGKDLSAKKKSHRKVVIDDFEMLRVLGKGCAGKVLLVRHKSTSSLYALKAITKRHVLAHQELQHTLTEQAVLKRMAAESKDPFVVKLWWSFHDKENLFLVMDFHPGGDLATQLARWGRLGRDRARFYAAEIVEGVEGLHAAGVIYRDLKPENILIGADGHIVLTDFGLSKEFPRRSSTGTAPPSPSGTRGEFYSSVPGTPQPVTPPWMKGEKGQELASGWPGQTAGQDDQTSTFCGTAEYLAPEVIQGSIYSYEVDWWSFGTMLYEMLTGITPFWADNHSDMYVRVLQDELQFPDDRAIDQDTKSLIRGLLQRNPALRICEPRIKKHPYFSMIDWSHVYHKRYIPPYIPPIDPSNASDTQNFDDTFLDMDPVIDDVVVENEQTDTDQERGTDTDRTDGEESNTTPSQSRSSSIQPPPDDHSVDVFDGYSFKGRHSVIIDDEEEAEEEESEEDEEDEEDGIAGREVVLEPRSAGLVVAEVQEEEAEEPKTPEARQASLPELPVEEDAVPPEAADDVSEEKVVEKPLTPEPKEMQAMKPPAVPPKTPHLKASAPRTSRGRREKSGVPALDRYLSDTLDEEDEMTEREDEDDDWDFVEAGDQEDRNGAKATSLFARGVVDRYRLAVFRKASTPTPQPIPRSFSSVSKASDAGTDNADSPSPSEKQRRGRTPLTFRKHPRQFLRPKTTPPSSFSAKSSSKSATTNSASTTLSSGSLLSPSPTLGSGTLPPSLRSKESAGSVGRQSNSDQSGHGDVHTDSAKGLSPMMGEGAEKHRPNKLRKYKAGADKVLSLFASPRQSS